MENPKKTSEAKPRMFSEDFPCFSELPVWDCQSLLSSSKLLSSLVIIQSWSQGAEEIFHAYPGVAEEIFHAYPCSQGTHILPCSFQSSSLAVETKHTKSQLQCPDISKCKITHELHAKQRLTRLCNISSSKYILPAWVADQTGCSGRPCAASIRNLPGQAVINKYILYLRVIHKV